MRCLTKQEALKQLIICYNSSMKERWGLKVSRTIYFGGVGSGDRQSASWEGSRDIRYLPRVSQSYWIKSETVAFNCL